MKRLIEAHQGEDTVLQRVPEEDSRLLQFFNESGLRPGASLHVIEHAPFKGTITVQVDEREVVLGTEVAEKLLVRA
jgi:Fe2+ transport system protein FeoA